MHEHCVWQGICMCLSMDFTLSPASEASEVCQASCWWVLDRYRFCWWGLSLSCFVFMPAFEASEVCQALSRWVLDRYCFCFWRMKLPQESLRANLYLGCFWPKHCINVDLYDVGVEGRLFYFWQVTEHFSYPFVIDSAWLVASRSRAVSCLHLLNSLYCTGAYGSAADCTIASHAKNHIDTNIYKLHAFQKEIQSTAQLFKC